MKTTFITAMLMVSLTVFMAACQSNQSANVNSNPSSVVAANEDQRASATPESGVDERAHRALIEALADERRAQATYEAVLAKFGDEARPFSNIVNAERRHESFLLPLFEKYRVPVPQNEFTKEKIQVPATLGEACQNAVKGENANIAMYDQFLKFVKEQDINETFVYLRDASKNNHLPAFERCGGGGTRQQESGGMGRRRNS